MLSFWTFYNLTTNLLQETNDYQMQWTNQYPNQQKNVELSPLLNSLIALSRNWILESGGICFVRQSILRVITKNYNRLVCKGVRCVIIFSLIYLKKINLPTGIKGIFIFRYNAKQKNNILANSMRKVTTQKV